MPLRCLHANGWPCQNDNDKNTPPHWQQMLKEDRQLARSERCARTKGRNASALRSTATTTTQARKRMKPMMRTNSRRLRRSGSQLQVPKGPKAPLLGRRLQPPVRPAPLRKLGASQEYFPPLLQRAMSSLILMMISTTEATLCPIPSFIGLVATHITCHFPLIAYLVVFKFNYDFADLIICE
jgi:hypothetical protein